MIIAVIVSIYLLTFIWCNGKLQSNSKVLATVGYSIIALLILLIS